MTNAHLYDQDMLRVLIDDSLKAGSFVSLTLTGPKERGARQPERTTVRPVRVKGAAAYQFEARVDGKALHRNIPAAETAAEMMRLLSAQFKAGTLITTDAELRIVVNKKHEVTAVRRPINRAAPVLSHDRKKQYIIAEDAPCEFLARLGVMTAEGRVAAGRHDKFRQVNRFLEMVADVVPALGSGERVNVVDFGCGKSYLTFALYHYLRTVRGIDAHIVGLDIKEDVVAHCQAIAADLGFEHLRFQAGAIGGYRSDEKVDMVVSLHACDTATDDALVTAVGWQSKVILAVPCCHHELFRKLSNDVMQPLLRHGVLKDRLTALVTDAIRGQLLEISGYSVQMLEFIEMEHTPKNILIRAVRKPASRSSAEAVANYRSFRDFWHITPHMERALRECDSRIVDCLPAAPGSSEYAMGAPDDEAEELARASEEGSRRAYGETGP